MFERVLKQKAIGPSVESHQAENLWGSFSSQSGWWGVGALSGVGGWLVFVGLNRFLLSRQLLRERSLGKKVKHQQSFLYDFSTFYSLNKIEGSLFDGTFFQLLSDCVWLLDFF